MKIDVEAVLRSRAPKLAKRLPRFAVRWLERLICQEEMNRVLAATDGLKGAPFCRAALREFGITLDFQGFPPLRSAAVVYASNHPLGGLDGIALIDYITRLHGVEPYFVVNDLLGVLEPLDGIFVPINKHGAQSRRAVAAVDRAFADLSRPVVMFPAGLCSRRDKEGRIRDLKWNKMFVHKAAQHGRDIITVRCFNENSNFFYNFASLRQRLGLKFNIEMVLLPREMVKAAGTTLRFRAGATYRPQVAGAAEMASELRGKVYEIDLNNGPTDNIADTRRHTRG